MVVTPQPARPALVAVHRPPVPAWPCLRMPRLLAAARRISAPAAADTPAAAADTSAAVLDTPAGADRDIAAPAPTTDPGRALVTAPLLLLRRAALPQAQAPPLPRPAPAPRSQAPVVVVAEAAAVVEEEVVVAAAVVEAAVAVELPPRTSACS